MVSYPAQPAPLSPHNAYTTWPGGIDPTVSVYRLPTTGGRITRKRKTQRKSRRNNRKNYRKSRRVTSRR